MSLWTKLRDAIVRPVLGAAINTVAPGLGSLVLPKAVVPVGKTPTPANPYVDFNVKSDKTNAVAVGRVLVPVVKKALPVVKEAIKNMPGLIKGNRTPTAKPGGVSVPQLKKPGQVAPVKPGVKKPPQNAPGNRLNAPTSSGSGKKAGRKPSCCRVCSPADRAKTPATARRQTEAALNRERRAIEKAAKKDTRTTKAGRKKPAGTRQFTAKQIAAQKRFAAAARKGPIRKGTDL